MNLQGEYRYKQNDINNLLIWFISFHSMWPDTIRNMNDNIHTDNAMEGSMNARLYNLMIPPYKQTHLIPSLWQPLSSLAFNVITFSQTIYMSLFLVNNQIETWQ